VTNPDLANVLRNMKVPERLTASQALRAYLLAQAEGGHDMPTGPTPSALPAPRGPVSKAQKVVLEVVVP
jgi:hypothetical protein